MLFYIDLLIDKEDDGYATFEDTQEERDFRQVSEKLVAREITPYRRNGEQKSGLFRVKAWKKLGKQGFSVPGCRKNTAGLVLISSTLSS